MSSFTGLEKMVSTLILQSPPWDKLVTSSDSVSLKNKGQVLIYCLPRVNSFQTVSHTHWVRKEKKLLRLEKED